jgi:hypothetical protein
VNDLGEKILQLTLEAPQLEKVEVLEVRPHRMYFPSPATKPAK